MTRSTSTSPSTTATTPATTPSSMAADTGCLPEFDRFVGLAYDASTLDYYAYRPSEESWAGGDRVISCVIWDPAGQVAGSLQGAAY
jgi:hypothetical protein